MKTLGTVTAVVNDTQVLVRMDSSTTVGSEYVVFIRISTDDLREKSGLPYLDIPKGEIRIVAHQDGDIYLAEKFRRFIEKRRIVSPTYGLLSGLIGREEVTEIPGPWSAEINAEGSLGVSVSKMVNVGDYVGDK